MKPKMIMMCGLPASGKSTKAVELAKKYNANIHSSDEIRKELSGDINNQNINDLVFQTLHNRIKEDLKHNKSCVYDATNIRYKQRKGFLCELEKIPCEKICVLMATPYEDCLKNNNSRDRKVPETVIEDMYKHFDVCWFYEGWDKIEIIYYPNSKGIYGCPFEWVESVKNFNQDNSHHFLTLGEHCSEVAKLVCKDEIDNVVRFASLIHDNGKCFTKTFENSKGEITKEAHYYNHERVGAYNSLFFDYSSAEDITDISVLHIAVLIRWHMQSYFIKNEKADKKYKNLWGEDLYNELVSLHVADEMSHFIL